MRDERPGVFPPTDYDMTSQHPTTRRLITAPRSIGWRAGTFSQISTGCFVCGNNGNEHFYDFKSKKNETNADGTTVSLGRMESQKVQKSCSLHFFLRVTSANV